VHVQLTCSRDPGAALQSQRDSARHLEAMPALWTGQTALEGIPPSCSHTHQRVAHHSLDGDCASLSLLSFILLRKDTYVPLASRSLLGVPHDYGAVRVCACQGTAQGDVQ
jgi:hypothetical protein